MQQAFCFLMAFSLVGSLLQERRRGWDEKGQRWEAETRTAPQSQQPQYLASFLKLELYHLVWTEKRLALEGNLRKTANLSKIDYFRKSPIIQEEKKKMKQAYSFMRSSSLLFFLGNTIYLWVYSHESSPVLVELLAGNRANSTQCCPQWKYGISPAKLAQNRKRKSRVSGCLVPIFPTTPHSFLPLQ